jgi:methionyl-tRNA formyltransferase
LVAAGYEIAAVIVAQNQMAKSRRERQLEVTEIAEKHSIPLLSPADLAEARDQLAGFGAEAAVLIAYGKIVPAVILDLFPREIINVHPSLLPRHRGPSPIESAILDGDQETGVSLMRLAAKMDIGPVYGKRTIPLKSNETKQDLADRLAALGADMVLEYLPKMLDGSAEPRPQDEAGATYDHLITKAAGQIDWTKPASRLEREIRAYAGWPQSRTKLGSTEVIITKAAAAGEALKPGEIHAENKRLLIGTGEGSLEILSLKPAGKPEMPAAAFLAGHKIR